MVWKVVPRVTTTLYIRKLLVGPNHLCDRFIQGGLNDDEPISKDKVNYLACSLAEDQPGGFFSTNMIVRAGASRQFDVSETYDNTG